MRRPHLFVVCMVDGAVAERRGGRRQISNFAQISLGAQGKLYLAGLYS